MKNRRRCPLADTAQLPAIPLPTSCQVWCKYYLRAVYVFVCQNTSGFAGADIVNVSSPLSFST